MRRPFYGWIIVGVSFLVGFAEAGVFQNILSIFMKPMVAEFGWSRASVTGAMAFGSIGGGLLSLVVGPLLDRYGPRMVVFWGILFLSLGLFAMMFVNNIWQFYLFFGAGRMIAVGALSLAMSVAVSNWFVQFRGRAMGIARVGDRLGSAVLPLMVQYFILALGWRMAWGYLGLFIFLMAGLPSLLFLRQRPEDMGLLPDGVKPRSDQRKAGNHPIPEDQSVIYADYSEPVWTRAQALRTGSFWVLVSIESLIPFVQAGINFHLYPFLTDQGFPDAAAVLVIATVAVFGIVGAGTLGMLTERFRLQKLMAANVIISGMVFLALYGVIQSRYFDFTGTLLIFILAALQGFFLGGRNPLFPLIWANYFGTKSLGRIYSMASPFHFTANAMGPVFAGFFFDQYGSYAFPFYLFTLVFFLSGILSLRMKPPSYPDARST